MGLFDRFRRKSRPGVLRTASNQDTSHLEQWTKSRQGVEAYVEPRTTVTETTVVLVAHDGEWTRRRIASPDAARSFARKLGMPIYDAGIVGYPKRMRDYTARQKKLGNG
ncbi:oxidoreductase [Lentzea sp. DG1S-22]|uniref:oxidoreductase n=1 Tax=unclassified Lentzea TaxID=2643253 RepID=UPI001F1F232D|nr:MULTISPECIES: oxidoreductase [unclassified Lentzea]MCG8926698.1 oxidoreductase [Lentzea sp. CC55]WVH77262.1 oxidoreductase [Lentzea sp. DG1S-22]